ncbi:hypothetical protein Poli38472_007773 [Pythium oligandrum]|uniref:Ubiquitin-like domain-containing protein n=1 Tax=Pythium oligandrum TaxID=41045 RepID=A0A8K1FMC8_PYTOL|nr:hypothetical protein Poli38472_007773 [Pythium oligandrum]|eukprot:TMW68101.1 hypothetical protein Poli38472_007773 [Pythium oligandrum]
MQQKTTKMLEVTVLNGKETIAVSVDDASVQWLQQLKNAVAERTGVMAVHQKLVFRGKELADGRFPAALKQGSKIMLLKNRAFYDSRKETGRVAKTQDAHDEGQTEDQAEPAPVAAVRRTEAIDVESIDENHVLLQAARGKAVYEFIFQVDTTISAVKQRVGGAMGLTGAALRLILKGKTPTDDSTLATYAGNARVIKCMVLLTAKQHDLMEYEDTFRETHRSLAIIQVEVENAARIMFKNVMPFEEMLLRLRDVQGQAHQVRSNLAILEDQLRGTKLADRDSPTMVAFAHAEEECAVLVRRADELVERFTASRH